MKTSELQQFKERLLQLRARLRGLVDAMADVALGAQRANAGTTESAPIDAGDNGDQEFTLGLMAAEGNLVDQVDAALERVAGGGYGLCVECGGRIPKARLNAIPYTRLCVKCASAREAR